MIVVIEEFRHAPVSRFGDDGVLAQPVLAERNIFFRSPRLHVNHGLHEIHCDKVPKARSRYE
jgi:hypothetical protein